MHAVYLLSVFIHILAAMLWLGGMGFLVVVLVPLLRRPALRAQAMALIETTGERFRTAGWVCLVLLVATGLFNLSQRLGGGLGLLASPALWASSFGRTLAWKLGLVTVILLVSAIHDFWVGPRATRRWAEDGASPAALRLRRWAGRLGRLTMVLALTVVALAVMLVRGAP